MLLKLAKGFLVRVRQIFTNPFSELGLSWFTVKQIKHQKPNVLRMINLNKNKVFYIAPQELMHGITEIYINRIYNQDLSKNCLIIDCGAHIGLSVLKWKELSPSCRIIAFEPDEKNFELLRRNCESNGLSDVVLERKAVWTLNQVIHFEEKGNMSSKIAASNFDLSRKVEAIRLRDFLIEPVELLKLDIEGAEYNVMLDIADKLDNVKRIFIEYHGLFSCQYKLLEIFEILNKAGFRFYLKEAADLFSTPFSGKKRFFSEWDIQLNIFCSREW